MCHGALYNKAVNAAGLAEAMGRGVKAVGGGLIMCALWMTLFFFSSRRRHTRLQGDWSSDVCSSDLDTGMIVGDGFEFRVSDTQKDGDLIIHCGHLTRGLMKAGAKVTARVDQERREGI